MFLSRGIAGFCTRNFMGNSISTICVFILSWNNSVVDPKFSNCFHTDIFDAKYAGNFLYRDIALLPWVVTFSLGLLRPSNCFLRHKFRQKNRIIGNFQTREFLKSRIHSKTGGTVLFLMQSLDSLCYWIL